MDSDEVTDELANILFAINTGTHSTREVTQQITRVIVSWSIDRGWSPRTEARVAPLDDLCGSRLGFVDVVIRRDGSLPDLAIEIDSTDKQWSVVKLRHAAELGMHAIWVRWGDEVWAASLEGIDVIQLQRARRVKRRRSESGQQPFW